MRSIFAIAIAVATVAACVASAAGQEEPPKAPADAANAQSFAFAIGNGQLSGGPEQVAERLRAFDLVVVDGELASAGEVAALRARGATVLAYLSVGTIEKWRSWYPNLKPYRLAAWRDWKDEWFADVSNAKLRATLTDKIAPAILDKGFDGLFLDNVDMIETRSHRAQRPGMRALVTDLASEVHGRGGLLFTQNGAYGLRKLDLLEAIDGWNREDVTYTYDFDHRRYVPNGRGARRAALRELAAFADRGLITTATDYTRAGDKHARKRSIRDACKVGALPYVSDLALTAKRLPDPPLTCP